jgi:hypothetical protein
LTAKGTPQYGNINPLKILPALRELVSKSNGTPENRRLPGTRSFKTAGAALRDYLKSEGRRSSRLHFSHSATFLTFPFSKMVFILTSPPQEQKNFWVALEVREFLLA